MNSRQKIIKSIKNNGYIPGGVLIKSDELGIIDTEVNNEYSMYFITMLQKLEKEKNEIDFGCIWRVGYFKTFEECKDILIKNITDLHEGLYDYAVIEKIKYGTLYPDMDCEQTFFIYEKEFNMYMQIHILEDLKQLIPQIIVFN